MAFQIIGNSNIYTRAYSSSKQRKQNPSLLALCDGKLPGSSGFPHKRPVMRKAFPCHDVIMGSNARVVSIRIWHSPVTAFCQWHENTWRFFFWSPKDSTVSDLGACVTIILWCQPLPNEIMIRFVLRVGILHVCFRTCSQVGLRPNNLDDYSSARHATRRNRPLV